MGRKSRSSAGKALDTQVLMKKWRLYIEAMVNAGKTLQLREELRQITTGGYALTEEKRPLDGQELAFLVECCDDADVMFDAVMVNSSSRKTHAAVVARLDDPSLSAKSVDVQRDLSCALECGASIKFISRQKRHLAPAAISDQSKDRDFKAACEARLLKLGEPDSWPSDRSDVIVLFCEFCEAHITVVWCVLRFVEFWLEVAAGEGAVEKLVALVDST